MFTGLSTTIKLGALCALIALLGIATTYGAWKWQGANIAKEVKAAEERKDKQLAVERGYIKLWRDRAEAARAEADAKKTKATVVTTKATEVIKQERKTNPAFYDQEVPTGGAEQWEAARKLMQ